MNLLHNKKILKDLENSNTAIKKDILKPKDDWRNVFFLGLTSFFMNICSAIVASTLMPYADLKGASGGLIDIARSFFEALAHFSKALIGVLSDYFKNRKVFLMAGYGLMPLTKLMFYLSLVCKNKHQGSTLFAFGQLLDRWLDATRDVARDSCITDGSSVASRNKAVAIRKAMACLGSFIGGVMMYFALKYKYHISTLENFYSKYVVFFASLPVIILFFFVKDSFSDDHKNNLKMQKDNPIKNNTIEKKDIFNFILVRLIKGVSILSIIMVIYNTIMYWQQKVGGIVFLKHFCISVGFLCLLTFIYLFYNLKLKKNLEKGSYFYILKKSLPKMGSFFIFLVIIFLASLSKFSQAFLWRAAVEQGLSIQATPLFFAFFYLFIGIMSYLSISFFKNKKGFLTLIIGFVSLLMFNLLMSFSAQNTGLPYFVIILIFLSFYESVANTHLSALASKHICDKRLNATYIGLLGFVTGFSGMTISLGSFFYRDAINMFCFNQVAKLKFIRFFGINLQDHFVITNSIYFIAIIPVFIAIILMVIFYDRLSIEKEYEAIE
jgi:MFS family permease